MAGTPRRIPLDLPDKSKARVAILTHFDEDNPAYSLCHVVESQVRMLTDHGHRVDVFVGERMSDGDGDDSPYLHRFTGLKCSVWQRFPSGLDSKVFASVEDLDDKDSEKTMQIVHSCRKVLAECDVVFTHDWISSRRLVPCAEATRVLAADPELSHLRWFHWVHSAPYLKRDWFNIPERHGENHRVVWLNFEGKQIQRVAKQFNVEPNQVKTIPNIIDLQDLFGAHLHPMVRHIVRTTGLQSAEITQVYPAAADRLADKGVETLIRLFGELKRLLPEPVCLVIVDGWTGKNEREDLTKYRKLAGDVGLSPNEVVFYSDIVKTFPGIDLAQFRGLQRGLPHEALAQLMSWGSLFIAPSLGEAGPMVAGEAALASGALVVVNRQVLPLRGSIGCYGESYDFTEMYRRPTRDAFIECAREILRSWATNPAVQQKTWVRRRWNSDAVYRDYYESILSKDIA